MVNASGEARFQHAPAGRPSDNQTITLVDGTLKKILPAGSYNLTMNERILVVEDEINLQETLVYNLNRQGFEVETAGDGNDAVAIALNRNPDLILLDIMLPGLDGFEVCKQIRRESNVPIIFLTARDDEIDRVVGFEIGGDDYVAKPFSMRELVARIKARLRMSRMLRDAAMMRAYQEKGQTGAEADEVMMFGNMLIRPRRREILVNGTPLVIKPKEYELMLYFAQNPGRTVSRDQILQQVWSYDFDGGIRTVDTHVRWIREKIEEDPSNPVRIVTVRHVGYRFEG